MFKHIVFCTALFFGSQNAYSAGLPSAQESPETFSSKIDILDGRTQTAIYNLSVIERTLDQDNYFTRGEKEPLYQEAQEERALLQQAIPFLLRYEDEMPDESFDSKKEMRKYSEYLLATNALDEFDKKFEQTLKELKQLGHVYEISVKMKEI